MSAKVKIRNFITAKASEGCSKSARYGCWVCPLFERDKTLSNLSNHYDYLKDMETFRNWLIDTENIFKIYMTKETIEMG